MRGRPKLEATKEQIAIRLSPGTKARLDALCASLVRVQGASLPRSEVLRLALERGMEALEAEVGRAPTRPTKPAKAAASLSDRAPTRPTKPAKAAASLSDFVEQVRLSAGKVGKRGRFGEGKVFISHVHQLGFKAISLDEFKAKLVQAHQQGLLVLARADLVQSMNPKDVQESETPHMNTVFHFVKP